MLKILTIVYPFLYLIVPMLMLWHKNIAEISLKLIYKLFVFFIIVYLLFYLVINNYFNNEIKTALVLFCLIDRKSVV